MAKKGEHYQSEASADAVATQKGLKKGIDYEIVTGPKGFGIRVKKKYVPVEGAQLHGIAPTKIKEPDEDRILPTNVPHIFFEPSTGRFRWADETGGLSAESYETEDAANKALEIYIEKELAPVETIETGCCGHGPYVDSNELSRAEGEGMVSKGEGFEIKLHQNPGSDTVRREMVGSITIQLPKDLDAVQMTHSVGDGCTPSHTEKRICQDCKALIDTFISGGVLRFVEHRRKYDDDSVGLCNQSEEEVTPIKDPSLPVTEFKPSFLDQLRERDGIGLRSSTGEPVTRIRRSTIESPTKAVWDIADYMKGLNPNVKRREVIAVCVAAGIADNTARTQYQAWLVAQRNSARDAIEAEKRKREGNYRG